MPTPVIEFTHTDPNGVATNHEVTPLRFYFGSIEPDQETQWLMECWNGDVECAQTYPLTECNFTEATPEATPEAQPGDGWITWGGGEPPVNRDTRIEVRLRGGLIGGGRGREFVWAHFGTAWDIVAYQIVGDAE